MPTMIVRPPFRHFLQSTLAWGIAVLPGIAAAQAPGLLWIDAECNEKIRTGWLTAACIAKFVGKLAVFFFQGVSMFFLLSIMYGGFQIALGYISGDKQKGVDRLQWSIIGFIVAVSVVLIMDLALSVLLG